MREAFDIGLPTLGDFGLVLAVGLFVLAAIELTKLTLRVGNAQPVRA